MKFAAKHLDTFFESQAQHGDPADVSSRNIMDYLCHVFNSGNPEIYAMEQTVDNAVDRTVTYRFYDGSVIVLRWCTEDKYDFNVEAKS